jgi:hypothetical protein
MKIITKTCIAALVVSLMMSSTSIAFQGSPIKPSQKPLVVEPTKVVTIKPAYGFYNSPVRTRLSKSEIDIIRRLQKIASDWEPASPPPINLIQWKIEPSAAQSATVALSIEAFNAARAFLSVPFNDATKPVVVVIGRSQAFLREQVNLLECQPNLALYKGEYLMGATICNRSVIVINLTGYLFLRYIGQPITTAMEQRPEPPFSTTRYTLVDRNVSGLAHEWTHVARNRLTDGFIPENEPAWFREGLAEVVSGLSRVKSSNGKLPYLHFHIIRLRKFSTWPNGCSASISTLRSNSKINGGCEYLRGAAALELLIANYGGLPKVIYLYEHMRESGDFFSSFKFVYNMTVAQFEARADTYARYISQVVHYGK